MTADLWEKPGDGRPSSSFLRGLVARGVFWEGERGASKGKESPGGGTFGRPSPVIIGGKVMRVRFICLVPMLFSLFIFAAEPPGLLNYQGVLRNSSDAPVQGTFDMVFTFYSGALAGSEILIDRHLAANGQAVTVTGGLFNVGLGGGTLADGSGAGVYASLTDVFRDFAEVWLSITVGGETLSPRVRIVSSAYALNSNLLDGQDSSYFINTSSAKQEKLGQLVAKGGIDFGTGAADDLTAADVTALTGGGSADALHSHLATNATLLDGIDSSQFLRSDSDDSFTSGTLTIASGTTLKVLGNLQANGTIVIDADGPDGNQALYFFEDSSATGESFSWSDTNDQFECSDAFWANGTVTATQFVDSADASFLLDPASTSTLNNLRLTGTAAYLNYQGPDALSRLYFYENGLSTGEWIGWNDTDDQFEISDALKITGDVSGARFIDYTNTATYLDPGSTSVLTGLSLNNTTLNLNVDGPDADQSLLFYDGGASGSQALRWDDSEARFELTAGTAVAGVLQVGSVSSAAVSYSRFGTGTPASGGLTSSSDVFVTNNLETGDHAFIGSSIIVGADSITPGQNFSSIGNGDNKDQSGIYRSEDFYVEGHVEVDGWIFSEHVDSAEAPLRLFSNQNIITMIDTDNNETTREFRWYHNMDESIATQLAEIQEDGDLRIRGTLEENALFGLAETFLAGEPLEPGELVRIDPRRPDGVLRTTGPGDPTVIGVVSTKYGVLLGAAPFDSGALAETWGADVAGEFETSLPRLRSDLLASLPELQREEQTLAELRQGLFSALAGPDTNEKIQALDKRAALFEDDLTSLALEQFFRERFAPVALTGRVPVKASADFGAIQPGTGLAPSPVPGVAMADDGRGPVIGTALEGLAAGQATILALIGRPTLPASCGMEAKVGSPNGFVSGELSNPSSIAGLVPQTGSLVVEAKAGNRGPLTVIPEGSASPDSELFRIDQEGNVFAKGAFSPQGTDLAEFFPANEPVQAGEVVVASREHPGRCELARRAGDTAVLGIVSDQSGVLLGRDIHRFIASEPTLAAEWELARKLAGTAEEAQAWDLLLKKFLASHAPVALAGTVEVKADAAFGSIHVGDLLTTSPTPGHVMRAVEPTPGTIVGKALLPLDSGTGTIRILIMLR